MADLVSNVQKVNDVEVAPDAPHSEALMTKIGATLNGLVDWIRATKESLGNLAASQVEPVWVVGTFNASYTVPAGFSFQGHVNGRTQSGSLNLSATTPDGTINAFAPAGLGVTASIPVRAAAGQTVSATAGNSSADALNCWIIGFRYKNSSIVIPEIPEIS